MLDLYTSRTDAGRGLAKRLMEAVLEECRRRGVLTVVLHASPQGRPMYEQMGFRLTNEVMLRLDRSPEP